jgi:TP53 regulating kinase and related kinases
MKEIARGAEAVIYLEKDRIIKHRLPKSYRIREIDETLRKKRTRRETKILEKLAIPHPKLLNSDDKEMKIEMEYIDGEKLRDVLKVKLCKKVGEYVGLMHNENIIHGDLTTSNMILKGKEIYFIDFGLSYFSNKTEDKAVDLHLLKEALLSKHYKEFEKAFKEVIKGYKKTCRNASEAISRLKKVEQRGRNKAK